VFEPLIYLVVYRASMQGAAAASAAWSRRCCISHRMNFRRIRPVKPILDGVWAAGRFTRAIFASGRV
jgi:hypothetical protein